MIDAYEWLGTWEPIEAPGRHCKQYPAGFAHGYQYDPHVFRQKGVSRAVPVEGRVGGKPDWQISPQARFWLNESKPSLAERVLAWLRGPC